MFSKFMVEDTDLQHKTVFGELIFWRDPLVSSLHSLYIPSNFDLLEDTDLKSLINFLNKDITKLNDSIIALIFSAFQTDLNEFEIEKFIISITQELTDWHPYLKYNCGIIVLDIIAHYISNIIIYHYRTSSENNAAKYIPVKTSCDFLYKLISTFSYKHLTPQEIRSITNYHEATIKQVLQTNSIDYGFISRIEDAPFGPLDEFEKLRMYIVDKIPSNRPDRNRYEWLNFLNGFHDQYGSLTRIRHQTFGTIEPRVHLFGNLNNNETSNKNTFFNLLGEPLYKNADDYIQSLQITDYFKYNPETFIQYIQAQLLQLSESDCAIKLCPDCLQYYLQKPHNQHNHDEYIKGMIKVRNKSYRKVYNQFVQHYSGIDTFQKYDLFQFHQKTYAAAIKHHISPQEYEKYISNPEYMHNKFNNLIPIFHSPQSINT